MLLRNVLQTEGGGDAGPWRTFAFFNAHGGCVATLDAAVLMVSGGETHAPVGAIRNVAVDIAWRGRGLFRALLDAALDWVEAEGAGATLLFTAEPDLYRRFGFVEALQHAFVGNAPRHESGPPARRLDRASAADVDILRRLFKDRAPLSARCALQVDWPLFLANVRKDEEIEIALCADLQVAIIFEPPQDDRLTIIDVVGPRMPALTRILGRIASHAAQIATLFPPDRLAWTGTPVADDTGLMIRGPRPAAMAQPFMLPPTVEF